MRNQQFKTETNSAATMAATTPPAIAALGNDSGVEVAVTPLEKLIGEVLGAAAGSVAAGDMAVENPSTTPSVTLISLSAPPNRVFDVLTAAGVHAGAVTKPVGTLSNDEGVLMTAISNVVGNGVAGSSISVLSRLLIGISAVTILILIALGVVME